MGSFVGHAVPGSFFAVYGLWLLVNTSLFYHLHMRKQPRGLSKRRNHKTTFPVWYGISSCRTSGESTCFFPIEPWAKTTLPLCGIFLELGGAKFSLYDDEREMTNVNDFSHAAMYFTFLLNGVVNLVGQRYFLPESIERLLFALAFSVETLLFAFHVSGHDKFDVYVHILLCLASASCVLSLVMQIMNPSGVMSHLALSTCILLQGTWLWQIAFVLYGGSAAWDPNIMKTWSSSLWLLFGT
eukprot:m.45927 g.45927  ORF g.45927 m.45927 type:complete len:241 (+) comp33645_c0_seq1:83-805(+)